MKKLTMLLSAACAVSFTSAYAAETTAASTSSASDVSAQVAQLQKQVNDLQTKVDQTSGEVYQPNVSISTYVGVESQFDGSELVVNDPAVNNDVALLSLKKKEEDMLMSKGMKMDVGKPRLIFSGLVESQASYAKDYNSDSQSDINLTDAELDSYLEISKWVNAYMTVSYNDGSPSTSNVDRTNESGFQLGQGFVTVGNFNESPVYSSVGQMYVPFGQYSSYMVSDSFAKTLGRVQTRALTLGYYGQQTTGVKPYASAFGFKGNTDINGSSDKVEEYGANLGLKYSKNKFSGDFAVSGISELAESSGMQGSDDSGDSDFGGFAQQSSYENLDHRVPGIDGRMTLGYGSWHLINEYVTATTNFDQDDMSFNGRGAKPRALNTELGYSFTWKRPSTVALAYNKSWEALAVGLPSQRWGATYTVSLWRHTALSFQYLRDTGYSSDTTATAAGNAKPVNTDQLGETYSSYILQFDAYF